MNRFFTKFLLLSLLLLTNTTYGATITDTDQISNNTLLTLKVNRGYLSSDGGVMNAYKVTHSTANDTEQWLLIKGTLGYYLYSPTADKFAPTVLSSVENYPAAMCNRPDGYVSLTKKTSWFSTYWIIECNSGKWMQLGGDYEYVTTTDWKTEDNGNKWTIESVGTYTVADDVYTRIENYENGGSETDEYWQDETVFAINKEEGRAWMIPYANNAELVADERYGQPWLDPKTSSRWMTLNGTWNVKVVDHPDLRPGAEEFYNDDVDVSAWETVSVPSCLEMKGFCEPYYINVNYAFVNNPPYISMLDGLPQPVASYRRDFDLPAGWTADRTLLHFDGIYSAAYVWVNGQFVGYTQGANNDHEFDISEYVREGKNNVSAQVFRWSDGSYLEGQDMWHMTGLFRDVYLVSVPRTFVRDHLLVADNFNSTYTAADLTLSLDIDNREHLSADKSFIIRLKDGDTVVAEQEAVATLTSDDDNAIVTIKMAGLTGLTPWTAETPYLYTIDVIQMDDAKNEEMAFSTKFGFREVVIDGSRLYINGQPVYLRGVNTQDTHPLYGRSIDVATMLKDVTMMKMANINTVRTSHYPRQAKMYAMFDHYGLYCMDEADNECHKSWSDKNTIAKKESWVPAFMDRMERMVLRDRNFPSVIIWSTGNESGAGVAHQSMYSWTKSTDPTRPVHYEGATNEYISGATDFCSVMYPNFSTHTSRAYYSSQPYIMCEYAHAMGQAVGSLDKYWDIIEGSPAGIGGCIWDWVDQSIYDAEDIQNNTLTQNGYPKFRTGNDYQGRHQGNFVNNGLITADRAWTGKLSEVKRIYQCIRPLSFDAVTQLLTLKNAYDFLTVDGYNLRYTLIADGKSIETGLIGIPTLAAGQQVELAIPYTQTATAGQELLLNIDILLPEPTAWATEGYEIATEQFVLQERTATLPVVSPSEQTLTYNEAERTVSGNNFTMRFDENGCLTSWVSNGEEIFSSAPTFYHYRWIENDAPYGVDPTYDEDPKMWYYTPSFSLSADSRTLTVTSTQTGYNANVTFTYIVYAEGVMDVTVQYEPQISGLRRLGTLWQLNPDYEEVTYYARGPVDNFNDRSVAARLGVYDTTVSDMFECLSHPQTTGYRTDLRYAVFTNPTTERSVRIDTEGEASLQALHYSDAVMHETIHSWELEKEDAIQLHLDYVMKGLGNNSCGGEQALSQYCVPNSGTYQQTFRFMTGTPEDMGVETAVSAPQATTPQATTPLCIHTLSGIRTNTFTRGVNIVNTNDGTKLVVK